jgi:hypothetical protein
MKKKKNTYGVFVATTGIEVLEAKIKKGKK